MEALPRQMQFSKKKLGTEDIVSGGSLAKSIQDSNGQEKEKSPNTPVASGGF